jgi:hypothetical protein
MRPAQEFQEQVGRIDKLVQKIESAKDPSLRGTARELIQTLMELHGAGLERVLEIVCGAGGEAGPAIVQALAGDELVSSLLVLYDLHPDDFETRVRRGLDKVRPLLRARGAGLEPVSIDGDGVHVRLTGAASNELREAVREALFETAPDAVDVVIEGAVEGGDRARSSSFVPLTSLKGCNGSPVLIAGASRP